MEDILLKQDFQLSGCTTNDCLVEVGRLDETRANRELDVHWQN